ncbi:hypothetical protein K439DRAFT_62403 [Ramaria rubella]|nr:hypothetical protein K439DRAFT_62403 [Ramaria rubella]
MEMSPYKIPFAMDGREVSPAVDVLILPKKLNHVIIGYSDGAILYDLLLRKVISCHLIPSSNAINPPSLTVLALHPVGQHYAAGYDDGTIRVWDIYSSKILWAGTTTESLECMRRNRHRQEPIFKMEWVLVLNQDGSSTSWLNVLGGLARPDSTCGLSALGFDTTYLHPTHLESLGYMHDSYLYPTSSLVQDFAIFSDNVPSAGRLFLLSGDDKKTLSLGAFIFPPPPNVPIGQTPHEEKVVELEFSAELEESKEVSRNLTATLEDFRSDQGQATAHRTPLRTPMPLTLNMGASRVLASELISLDSAEYLRLSKQQSEDATFEGQFRIMITQHEDASIRFYDASTLPGVNLSLHPRALDHLTIHVTEIPEIALRPDIHSLRIARVVVAKESLECAVQLTTGEVVMLGLGIRPRTQDELDNEIVDLSDVRDRGDIFVPRFMLQAQPGSPNTIGLSDIGFLAVAYQHGLLVVLDLRGPKIILRDFQNETAKHTEADMVVSLSWVISGVGDDNSLAPRLLSLQKDGSLIIYTLIRPNEAWIVDKSHTIRHNHLSPHPPIFAAVFDARDGIDCRATPTRFANAIGPHADTKTNATHCFWVAANRREIRTNLNITGDKVSRVNLSSQDALQYTYS